MNNVLIAANDKIILKSWKPEYAPQLFGLVDKNRSTLQVWLPWVPTVQKVEDSQSFIKDAIKDQGVRGLELGIWYEEKLVGCIGLHEIDTRNQTQVLLQFLDSLALESVYDVSQIAKQFSDQ